MMLCEQEVLALELIFRSDDELSAAIKQRIEGAESVDREKTGVGFFSKIKLRLPLDNIPEIRMWDYNFSHPDFPHGGSFMCSVVSENELELEAVAFGGAHWPNPSSLAKFEELM